MPKNEIDPEDPLELHGVVLPTDEDTSETMTESFIEEFLRLGLGPRQILALFRNRHYVGPHGVFEARGEEFVKSKIIEVFGWWGHRVVRATPGPAPDGPTDACADPVHDAPPAPHPVRS